MNSLVIITRPRVGGYDQVTREYTQPATITIYDTRDAQGAFTGLGAKAGVSLTNTASTFSIGDEPTYYSSITCYVPNVLETNIHIDDVVKFMVSPDIDIVGREFRVTDVPAGGRINTSTDLSCVGIDPSRQWGQQ